MPIYSKISS